MVKWEAFSENFKSDEWDSLLSNSEDYNVFQSHAWGEYKKTSDWIPERWIVKNSNGSVICMVQILTKSFFPAIKIGWAPGGPVFQFPQSKKQYIGEVLRLLLDKIAETSGQMFFRFNSQIPNNASLAYSFNQNCFKPIFRINSGYSFFFDLIQPLYKLKNEMTSKHRYYVNKALDENIEWKAGNKLIFFQEFSTLYKEMAKEKDIKSLKNDINDLINLCSHLQNNAIVFTGYIDNYPITSCIALKFYKKAFYFMAATGKKGREISASYAMIYKLFEHLKDKGITMLDFGGINPCSNSAEGVNHFKRGFRGELVEYLGEWEWSNSRLLRYTVNLAIHLKRGRL